ncbi:MAG: hypothetical protein Q8M94_13270 [Ignavibacteria bacterium]|nr:hypothetical protein [Ignavibacteria bacterium]
MKKTYKAKIKEHRKDNGVFFVVSNWDNVEDYSEEEIEDLLDENHIPEISYIEVIKKPKDIIFD